jgi:hypothetical protein
VKYDNDNNDNNDDDDNNNSNNDNNNSLYFLRLYSQAEDELESKNEKRDKKLYTNK